MAILGLALPAVAAPPALVATVLSNAQITVAFKAPRTPGHTARAIAPADTFRYWAVKRTQPGAVEIHHRWVDVMYVRAGSAELRTGMQVKGDWSTGHGEWRGGHILHPRISMLHTGDRVLIPAGLAHQFIPLGKTAFEYITIKVPATMQAEAVKRP